MEPLQCCTVAHVYGAFSAIAEHLSALRPRHVDCQLKSTVVTLSYYTPPLFTTRFPTAARRAGSPATVETKLVCLYVYVK